MKLIVPDLHPAAVLQAMALAQSAPDAYLILTDERMQPLLLQSAQPLRTWPWQWPAADGGLMETELAQRIRWRKPLDELRKAGLTGVVHCAGAVDESCPSKTLAVRLSACLGLPLSESTDLVDADAVTDSAIPTSLRLFAHADSLARVAHMFRQVPAHKTGSFRFIWVLQHADATHLAVHHGKQLQAFLTGLSAHAVHLHVVRVVPDGVSPMLLARDEGLRHWQAVLQQCVSESAGSVVDLGAVQGLAGCGVLCALLAHADVVLHTGGAAGALAGGLAQGLGKSHMQLLAGNVLCAADSGGSGGVAWVASAETSMISEVCDRFPFIVKP